MPTRAIHDYSLAKSLDEVWPHGVMALITRPYSTAEQNAAIRGQLARL
jgi:hypothetical protein